MSNLYLEHVCKRALDNFGVHGQVLQAIEKCAELSVALLHRARGKVTAEAVITEIADVAIMVEQLTQMYGRDLVDAEIQRKLERLERKL